MTDFHPDDPTVWLWKKLLRLKPVGTNRKTPNKFERKKISREMRNYWLEHPHPRKGKPFGKKK